jgi:hypothetical protein
MHMKCLALALAMFLGSCALHAQAPATGANPFLGSWRLNFEKSGITVPAGIIVVRQYQDQGGGLMLHTIASISPDPNDGAGFTFAAARYDGKDYPVFVPETLGTFLGAGSKPTRTVAFIRKDANTLEWTDRQSGTISATGVNKVAEDGKSMTETVKVFDAQGKQTSSSVAMFDKQ